MNRFLRFVKGTKPEVGLNYYHGEHVIVLKSEDISNSLVRIRYKVMSDEYLTFREFHATYSDKKTLTRKDVFESEE